MLAADDVASVIIARSGPWIDAMSLQKLLYYVQAWHLAVTDEPLFRERIQAWKDGPVVREVWDARKARHSRRAADQTIPEHGLDELASDLVDLVLATYGSMSGEELSVLTHVEEPWKEARGDLPPEARCTTGISTESMARFYRSHRRLGGRTAADIAAAGVHIASHESTGTVDVDDILRSLGPDFDAAEADPWGGANLESARGYDSQGIKKERHRANAGA